MNGSFYEQLGGVAELFEQWGACERTVVACALARRVPWPGLRLLQRAVEAALEQARLADDERLERDANDEHYLAGLLAPADDDDDHGEARLQQAVRLVPLLRRDSAGARGALVAGAAGAAQRALHAPRTRATAELTRQLLCYLLVHPALTPHDQRSLSQWLRFLEKHMSGSPEPWVPEAPDNIWSGAGHFRRTVGKNVFRAVLEPPEPLVQEPFASNGRDVDLSDCDRLTFDATIAQPKSQRSNSLTTPYTEAPLFHKPRSLSLSSAGGPRPDARDRRRPGMAAVPHWLKTLRLHKYLWIFADLSYHQMMAIDEPYLEQLGVTRGARHKILVSLAGLRGRGAALAAAEAALAAGGGGGVARALDTLRAVLLSPLPPDSDLPAHVVRLLMLTSKVLQEGGGGGGGGEAAGGVEPLSLHCWLVERALHHEAFRAHGDSLRRLRHRLPPRQFYLRVRDLPRAPRARPAPAPPPPRAKSHSYPPGAFDDYCSSLDALCRQMTEQAIN